MACLADAYSVVAALGCYLGLEAFSSEMTFPLYVLSLSLFKFSNSGRKCVRVLGVCGLCREEGGGKR